MEGTRAIRAEEYCVTSFHRPGTYDAGRYGPNEGHAEDIIDVEFEWRRRIVGAAPSMGQDVQEYADKVEMMSGYIRDLEYRADPTRCELCLVQAIINSRQIRDYGN